MCFSGLYLQIRIISILGRLFIADYKPTTQKSSKQV